jgi:hypothetical protein
MILMQGRRLPAEVDVADLGHLPLAARSRPEEAYLLLADLGHLLLCDAAASPLPLRRNRRRRRRRRHILL